MLTTVVNTAQINMLPRAPQPLCIGTSAIGHLLANVQLDGTTDNRETVAPHGGLRSGIVAPDVWERPEGFGGTLYARLNGWAAEHGNRVQFWRS